MTEICSAPSELKQVCSEAKFDGMFDRFELRLPIDVAVNKAALLFEHGQYLASFTVWGAGTIEWIVVDGNSGDVLTSVDEEFASTEDLRRHLDLAVVDLSKRVKKSDGL